MQRSLLSTPIQELIAKAKMDDAGAILELGNRYKKAICGERFKALPDGDKIRRCTEALDFIEKGHDVDTSFDNAVAIRQVLKGENNEAFQLLLIKIEKIMADLTSRAE
jgi:hypothetical protein